ncbi:short-chain dehydrogenase/reductase SDR [Methylorubrum populi]|uniref:Short-chain dehydrogenase/reductase SDR n=1 Tax=Methylorubrum populi TaxID=223967 RepID=A0A160PKY4_9HYPH|nr:oxidoreductase [Methylorubrum populi]BAU92540.1 short-chain dehydrogenase/reductase SDR [Methylorubrum populi]
MARQRWTVADIPSQAGRRAVVTGASAGLGFETARALAGAGASVVLAVRDPEKGERAAAAIRRAHPGADLSVRPIDTASLASVRAFAGGWPAEASIDRLVLNAGIAAVPRREESADGFERQLATNFLGHFALTGLLLPALSPAARVVSVASLAHRSGTIRFDDLHWRETYAAQPAYRQSKLALLMFALELDRRLKASGSGIASLAAHPGLAVTEVFRRGDRAGAFQQGAGRIIFSLIGQPAAQGALPILYAATATEAERGGYYGPDGVWEARGFPRPASIAPRALDRAAAGRLWTMSERLTGVRFPL